MQNMQIFSLTKKQKKKKKKHKQKGQKSPQSPVAVTELPIPQKLTQYMFHNLFNQRCIRRYIFQFIQSKRKRESCYSARISDGAFRVKVIVLRQIAPFIQKRLIKTFSIIDGALQYCGDGIVFIKMIFRYWDFAFAIGSTIPWKFDKFNQNDKGWYKIDWERNKNYDLIMQQQLKNNGKCNRSQQTAELQTKTITLENYLQKQKQVHQIANESKQPKEVLQIQFKQISEQIKKQQKLTQQQKNKNDQRIMQFQNQKSKEKSENNTFQIQNNVSYLKPQNTYQPPKRSSRKLLLSSQNQIQLEKQFQKKSILQLCDDDIDDLFGQIIQDKELFVPKNYNQSRKTTQKKILTQSREEKIQQILDFLDESQFPQTKSLEGDKQKTYHEKQESKTFCSDKKSCGKLQSWEKNIFIQKQILNRNEKKSSMKNNLFSENQQKFLNLKEISQYLAQASNNKKSENKDRISTKFENKINLQKKQKVHFDYQDLFQQDNLNQEQNLNSIQRQSTQKYLISLQNLIHCTSSVSQKSWVDIQFFLISDQLSDQKINKKDKKNVKFKKGFCCNNNKSVIIPCRIQSSIQVCQQKRYHVRNFAIKESFSQNIGSPFMPFIFIIDQNSEIRASNLSNLVQGQKSENLMRSIKHINKENQEGQLVNFIGIIKSYKIIKLNKKFENGQNSNTSCSSNSKMLNMDIVDPFTGCSISFIDFANNFSFQQYNVQYFPIVVMQGKVSFYKNKKGIKSYLNTLYKINYIPNYQEKQKWEQFLNLNFQNIHNIISNLQPELQGYKQFQCVDDIYFAEQNQKGKIYCQIITLKKMKYLGCLTCSKKVIQGSCKSCGPRKSEDIKLYQFTSGVFADQSGSIKFMLSTQCINSLKKNFHKQVLEVKKTNKQQIEFEIDQNNQNNTKQNMKSIQNEESMLNDLIMKYGQIWFTKGTNNKPISVESVKLSPNIITKQINKVMQSL